MKQFEHGEEPKNSKPETEYTFKTNSGTKPKTRPKKLQEKVKISEPQTQEGDDTEPETYDCECCSANGYETIIECKRSEKWGCPECTKISLLKFMRL